MKVIPITLVAIGLNIFTSIGYAHNPKEEHYHGTDFGFSGTYSGNTEFKPNTLNYIKIRSRWNDQSFGRRGFLDHLFLYEIECHNYCRARPGPGGGPWIPGKCWDEEDDDES